MIKVAFSSSFKRSFKLKIAPNAERLERFWRAVEIFRTDPYHPSLKIHKLSGKLKHVLSFSVEYDLRVIFYFENGTTARFINIGTHDDVY
jgi:mRNA-degrading endonuclease YafQ of YafQ-DinJ toxin-antitoxin module